MPDNRIFVDTKDRTFETRLQFINEIFSNLFDQSTIMTSCINYKLTGTYDQYLSDLDKSLRDLYEKDPLKVLKRLQ